MRRILSDTCHLKCFHLNGRGPKQSSLLCTFVLVVVVFTRMEQQMQPPCSQMTFMLLASATDWSWQQASPTTELVSKYWSNFPNESQTTQGIDLVDAQTWLREH